VTGAGGGVAPGFSGFFAAPQVPLRRTRWAGCMSFLGLTAALALLAGAALAAVVVLATVLVGLHRLEAATVTAKHGQRH